MFFYTRKTQDGILQVKLNSTYMLSPQHQFYGFVETLVPLLQNKNELRVFPKQFQIWLYSSLQMKLAGKTEQICTICIQPIICKYIIQQQLEASSSKDGYCLKCKHIFHKGCLQDFINKNTWFNCPKCSQIYGVMLGDMPDGIMSCTINNEIKCSGYERFSTLVIKYEMFAGQKSKEKYSAAEFEAYLPNSSQGQKIAKMMQECFRRKLTFIVKKNQYNNLIISWSSIPHKSAPCKSKSDLNGYPDPGFLDSAEKYMTSLGINV